MSEREPRTPREPVPVAVIGAGNMGGHHARNYHELAGAELKAVVDVDGHCAERLTARLGGRPFTDVSDLLAAELGVVAASVATPTNLHHETVSQLFEAGIHVLVEKPLSSSMQEAHSLIRQAEQASLVLAVGHVERFNPAVRELKRRIAIGEMGSLLSLIARRVGVMPPQVKDANVILDLAIHDIDIFRYLLDADRPGELYCNAGKAIAADRYDFADIFLRFDGVACFLQVNWLTPVKIRSLSVTGTKAYAELSYVTQQLDFYPAQTVRDVESFADVAAYSEQEPLSLAFEHREPLAQELEEFLKAVRGEPAEIVTGEEAALSMETTLAVVELADRR